MSAVTRKYKTKNHAAITGFSIVIHAIVYGSINYITIILYKIVFLIVKFVLSTSFPVLI
jgi:hypothetical protein